jgi:hypothetical protein
MRRFLTAHTRLVVEDRDGGCRVPGCGARSVQIHHVQHWEDQGPTETANLIALCLVHHRIHHTLKPGVSGTDAGEPDGITFHRPDGRRIPGVSPPAPPEAPPLITVEPYACPEAGRIDARWVTFLHDRRVPHPTAPPARRLKRALQERRAASTWFTISGSPDPTADEISPRTRSISLTSTTTRRSRHVARARPQLLDLARRVRHR